MKKSIEDRIVDKIFETVNYLLSKVVQPDIKLEDVTQLDEDMIQRLKENYGIEGVILDVDNTLRKNMRAVPTCNQEWLDMIRRELKVIVVSNGKDKKAEELFRQKEIEYIGFAHKPLKKNFIKACQRIDLKPESVLVIGDQIIDDIYGGKKNNMKTALVNSVKGDEER